MKITFHYYFDKMKPICIENWIFFIFSFLQEIFYFQERLIIINEASTRFIYL